MLERINTIFEQQQKYKFYLRGTDAKVRIEKLRALKKTLQNFEEELYESLNKDLRKNKFEASVTEVFFSYAEIDFAVKNLNRWLKPKGVKPTLSNLFARNKIYYEPKGVCLIIAPWNYPLQLVMSPLISAIAAGNCVIVKPSEISSHTAAVIHKIISKTFNPEEIACVEGGVDVSKELLNLPFDHIFFTGSTSVGKIVMEAAAKSLSSITLELGGKSPAIVDETADLKSTAEKLAWGKLVNVGQTCIAPDYVLIDEQIQDKFLIHYRAAVHRLYFKNETEIDENSYGKIINEKQFNRLNLLINQAVKEGAKIELGGNSDTNTLTIYPTVLTGVTTSNTIMKEEIFGPILPILTYKILEEAIDIINLKEKPLALYIFSASKKNQQEIIKNTSAGGTCINDVLIHISNPNVPFGGINQSGVGSCHGVYGFKSFSHERAVVFQSRFGLTKLIYPPYSNKMNLLKWLKKLM